MHFIFLTAALPLTLVSAGLSPRSLLLPRQGGDAFVPSTGSIVTSCATPCGADECLDVPRGDTCCTEGCECPHSATQHDSESGSLIANGFFFLLDGCPGGSFCLTQGYCCPDVSFSANTTFLFIIHHTFSPHTIHLPSRYYLNIIVATS